MLCLNVSGESLMSAAKKNWIQKLFSPAPSGESSNTSSNGTVETSDERIVTALVSVIVAECRTTQGLSDLDFSDESAQQLVRSRLLFLHSELSRISESVNISTPDLVGLEYTDGLAANVENGSDVDFSQTTYIHQVIEPLVMQGERVLHPARVVLSNELPATHTGGH